MRRIFGGKTVASHARDMCVSVRHVRNQIIDSALDVARGNTSELGRPLHSASRFMFPRQIENAPKVTRSRLIVVTSNNRILPVF